MIGYGTADTEIEDIDRRNSDGMLALMLKSSEPNLVGSAGSSDNRRSLVAYDPVQELYIWFKVLTGDFNHEYPQLIYFSPDGSKVLAAL